MFYPIGLFVAATCILAAIGHLNQHIGTYYDFVALVIVTGGTVSVALITFPWQYSREIRRALTRLLISKSVSRKLLLAECINFVRQPTGYESSNVVDLPAQTLRDGAELLGLGFTSDKISLILRARIEEATQRSSKVANAMRGLAKYPPAFGLVGTVLGLVNLMRAVSTGADAKETGVQMAVALVATLYGLLTANLLVGPAGELMFKNMLEDHKLAEVALEAVLLTLDGTNPLEAQELLNSYFPIEDRINITSSFNEHAGAAA